MPINLSKDYSGEETKEKKDILKPAKDLLMRFSRVPLKEKLFFVQYLSVMVRSGIPLSTALKTLSTQTKHQMFRISLLDISAKVEKGVSFAESLRGHSRIFNELFVNMIDAGEQSGKLENTLGQLFIQMKKNYELTSKVKSALTYPAVILFAMVGIGIFMMAVVVPQITSMFKELNADLPLATKIIIKISDTMAQDGIMVAIAGVVLALIFARIIKTEKGKYYFQLSLLRFPVIGPIIKMINLAKFSRTISALLKTDIMIIKSFQIAASTLGNIHYRLALLKMSENIKKGESIASAIKSSPALFPPVVAQMVAVGEETGEIDSILEELAAFYEGEVDQTMTNLPAIIEPLLILVLGCGVGAMAVAVIMPMYSLSTAM